MMINAHLLQSAKKQLQFAENAIESFGVFILEGREARIEDAEYHFQGAYNYLIPVLHQIFSALDDLDPSTKDKQQRTGFSFDFVKNNPPGNGLNARHVQLYKYIYEQTRTETIFTHSDISQWLDIDHSAAKQMFDVLSSLSAFSRKGGMLNIILYHDTCGIKLPRKWKWAHLNKRLEKSILSHKKESALKTLTTTRNAEYHNKLTEKTIRKSDYFIVGNNPYHSLVRVTKAQLVHISGTLFVLDGQLVQSQGTHGINKYKITAQLKVINGGLGERKANMVFVLPKENRRFIDTCIETDGNSCLALSDCFVMREGVSTCILLDASSNANFHNCKFQIDNEVYENISFGISNGDVRFANSYPNRTSEFVRLHLSRRQLPAFLLDASKNNLYDLLLESLGEVTGIIIEAERLISTYGRSQYR